MQETINNMIIIIALIQCLLGLILIYKAVKIKIQVIWLLAFDSFLQALIFLIFVQSPFVDFGNIFPFMVGLSYLLIVIFIHETFYKKQKRVYILYIVIIILCTVGYVLGLYEPDFPIIIKYSISIYIFAWYNFLLTTVPHSWCSYVILKQYLAFRNKNIQPWIKMRYLIAGISHIPWGILGVYYLYFWYAGNIPLVNASIVISIAITIFTVGYFIAWVMPEPLKKFFNRYYEIDDEKDMSEEEIMQIIQGGRL